MTHGRARNLTIALMVWAGCAHAEPVAAPAAEPEIPSLDDLLGLDSGNGSGDDATDAQLDRKLSAQQMGEQFQQAVSLMGDAAERIAAGDDLGLQTQRMQEEVLRRLDQVIEAAKQNQSGGQGSSSSSSGQQQQQPPGTQSSQSSTPGQPGSESGESHMPGASTDATLNPALAPDGVTWGNLPSRERDAVSQGVTDRYSSLYRRLTELYYRKLAEREGEE